MTSQAKIYVIGYVGSTQRKWRQSCEVASTIYCFMTMDDTLRVGDVICLYCEESGGYVYNLSSR